MVPLARRTLLHHRRRLAAALAGVVFAVVLVNMEVGILNGFMANAVVFIDNMPADVWVMAPGTPTSTCPTASPSRNSIGSGPSGSAVGREDARGWGFWKTSAGTEENAMVMACPPTAT